MANARARCEECGQTSAAHTRDDIGTCAKFQPPRRAPDVARAPALIEHEGFVVVRDDLFPGGTKARVLPALFEAAVPEYVYASPAQGYAQVALAYAARAAGKRATVFVAQRQTYHPRTAEAAAAGARIVPVPAGYLTVVTARARAYCAVAGATLLPFGLDTEPMRRALADLARALPVRPREVWTVAGSGTLTRALQEAWPRASFHAVQIGAHPAVGRAHLYHAPEAFAHEAEEPPPFPSCGNYDAKAWRFLRAHARPGALFWNVAA